jgi:hypothetical protein
MSQSKREQVVSHLRYIRQELREMHQGVMEDGLLPEAGEVPTRLTRPGASSPRGDAPLNGSAPIDPTRATRFSGLVPITWPRLRPRAFLLESPISSARDAP